MSDERFASIEATLQTLVAGQAEFRGDITEIKGDIREIKTDVSGLKTDVGALKAGVSGLDKRLTRVEVLQEEMRDDIKLIAEGHAALLAHCDRRVDDLRTELDGRITPIEQAIRVR